MLTLKEGTALVTKTRRGVEAHLHREAMYDPGPNDETMLWTRRGVFVTITEQQGSLRGCIGNPEPIDPLIVEAIRAGILATSDPRFLPVTYEELKMRDRFELTVISPLEKVLPKDPSTIVRCIDVGKHGIIVDGNGQRGLLLPQVAVEEGFDAEDLVTNCCLKAGLPPDSWLEGETALYRFTGQIFSEETANGRVVERRLSSE